MSQTVKLYGIEAELPPGCSVARLNEHGEPCLCQPGSSDLIVICYTAGPLEIFAATVICHWDDIILSERVGTKIAYAEKQSEKWRAIRAKAIKEHQKWVKP